MCYTIVIHERVMELKKGYAVQLFTIVKNSKRAVSYEQAAKTLKAANPNLEDTEKNTVGIRNILERFVVNGKMSKTRTGNYKIAKMSRVSVS